MGIASTRHQAHLMQAKVTQKINRPNGNYSHAPHQWGVVASINLGPPPSVNLHLSGTNNVPSQTNLTLAVPYLSSYVPAIGDVVLLQRGVDRGRMSRVVLGKLVGSPSPYPVLLGSISPSTGQYITGPSALWGGVGAPPNSIGNNGDYYFRSDQPLTLQETIYVKSAGEWYSLITPNVLTENYIVPGVLSVTNPASSTTYLAPFFVPAFANQFVVLTSVTCAVRQGSCRIQLVSGTSIIPTQQAIPGASNTLAVTTTPRTWNVGTTMNSNQPVDPFITQIASAPDNLSVSFLFTVIP